MKTVEVQVDLYVPPVGQVENREAVLGSIKRIFDRLGGAVYWFFVLWEKLQFCTSISEFGLNLGNVFHKRENGEKF